MSSSSIGFIMCWCIFLKWLPNLNPKTWIEIFLVSSVNFGAVPLSCAIKHPPTQVGPSSAQPSLHDFSPFPAAFGFWPTAALGSLAPARQCLGHHLWARYHGSCSWTYFFKLKGHLLKHRTSPNSRNLSQVSFLPGRDCDWREQSHVLSLTSNPQIFFAQQQGFGIGRAESEWQVWGVTNGMALGSCTLRDTESTAWVIYLQTATGELWFAERRGSPSKFSTKR